MKKLFWAVSAIVFGLFTAAIVTASRDASGTYSLYTPGNPVVTDTSVSSTWANNTLGNLATGITDSLDRQGRGSMIAPLKLSNGSSSAPACTFASETASGLYKAGSSDVRMSINTSDNTKWTAGAFTALGTLSSVGNFAINTNKFNVTASSGNTAVAGTLTTTGVAAFADGVVGTPGVTFTSDTDVGLYRIGADNLGVSIGGVKAISVAATGTTFGTGSGQTGDVVVSEANPASTTAYTNTVTPMNIPKAWGTVAISGATPFVPSVTAGFNVTSVSRVDTSTLRVTLATTMANANYAVMLSLFNTCSPTADCVKYTPIVIAKTTTTFDVVVFKDDGTIQALDGFTQSKVSYMFVLFGAQ